MVDATQGVQARATFFRMEMMGKRWEKDEKRLEKDEKILENIGKGWIETQRTSPLIDDFCGLFDICPVNNIFFGGIWGIVHDFMMIVNCHL